jgi:4-hydroxy-3-polyprenylbenzoate decarboxylase
MVFKDMRVFLNKLEEEGELVRVKEQMENGFEITAFMYELWDRMGEKAPAVMFENVKGYDMPVAVGILSSFRRYALAFGMPNWKTAGYKEVKEKLISLWEKPHELKVLPKVVSKEEAPCKEVILEGGKATLDKLPILKWHPQDGQEGRCLTPGWEGRFITWGCVVHYDKGWNSFNMGCYRIMLQDNRTLSIMSQRLQHIGIYIARARAAGIKKFPTAIVIGPPPALMAAAGMKMPHPSISEYVFTGTLTGEPIELVKCETSDLLVPATAEIVIEGEMLLDQPPLAEGPFAEYQGYVGSGLETPPFKVTCITMRKDPIYVNAVSGHKLSESNFGYVPWITIQLQAYAKTAVNGFRDLCIPYDTRGFIAIVQIEKRNPGWGKQAVRALLGSPFGTALLNMAIAVDEDVNIYDWGEVMWAVATRVDPELDVEIFPPTGTIPLNPAGRSIVRDPRTGIPEYTFCSKIGIDATRKFEVEPGRTRGTPPLASADPKALEKIRKNWDKYFPAK